MRRFSLPQFFEAGTRRVRAGGDSAPAGATQTGRDASTATSRVSHQRFERARDNPRDLRECKINDTYRERDASPLRVSEWVRSD